MQIVAWIQANWLEIGQIITSVIGIASIIVKFTPTLKDDTVLLTIIKFVAKYLALNVNAPKDEERPS